PARDEDARRLSQRAGRRADDLGGRRRHHAELCARRGQLHRQAGRVREIPGGRRAHRSLLDPHERSVSAAARRLARDRVRVLYVEDDPADRELTLRYLERHAPQLELITVGTIAKALDRLAADDVDLVLSDYRLPDGTGLELLEAIKSRDLDVPVVLVTGTGSVEVG